MELGIKGKIALVTGGATGIGQAITVDLRKEGVQVAFTSRNQESIDETLKLLPDEGANDLGICVDITEEGAPKRVVDEINEKLGDIDIIVNNAGDTLGVTDPFCPIDDWRRLWRLNCEVHVEVNNLALPKMIDKKWGRIVNISSLASVENSGPVPFCATKSALTAYTRCMGRVLAPTGVVMSVVLPGVVMTERGNWAKVMVERPEHAEKYLEERCPLKRFGEIYEISPWVVMLCSEQASFCQGSVVPVDGGQSKQYFR